MPQRASTCLFASALASVLASCSSSTAPSPTSPASTPPKATAPAAGADLLPGCTLDPGAPAGTVDANAASDPTGGPEKFTLAQAMAGFPEGATGKLVALIQTEQGPIRCELAEAQAPISVANFVGLARGTRPYVEGGKWVLGRFYDGLIWHRVVPGFVIQGGDPLGAGTGGPGYTLPVENQVEEPLGTLAQAAAKAPSGSQYYVVVGKGPPAAYNVFGACNTEAAVKIAGVARGERDRPVTDVHMQRVDIARCP